MPNEKCSSCEQMKKENNAMRKAMTDTSKGYVEVVNENLELKRLLEQNSIYMYGRKADGA